MYQFVITAFCLSCIVHAALFFGFSNRVLFDLSANDTRLRDLMQVDMEKYTMQMVAAKALDEAITTPEETANFNQASDINERMKAFDAVNPLLERRPIKKPQQTTQAAYANPLTNAPKTLDIPRGDPQSRASIRDSMPDAMVPTRANVPQTISTKASAAFQTYTVPADQFRADEAFYGASTFRAPGASGGEATATAIAGSGAAGPRMEIGASISGGNFLGTRSIGDVSVGRGQMNVGGGLGALIDVRCDVYDDRLTGEQYVRLLMQPKAGTRIPRLPKDVLFLVDVSGSITTNDIRRVRQEVWDAIKALNPEDRFNLVVFSVHQQMLFDSFQPSTPMNLQMASACIERLEGSRETDIYQALMQVVPFMQASDRVLHVVLMSDAKPTEGERDFRKIINDFTRNRVGNVAFFTYDVGKVKDQFLLDYLSYENRGVAFHDESAGNYQLSLLMREYANPMIYDLRVDNVVMEQGEVFPRLMPHFYGGQSMAIYAKMPHADAFSMQVSGIDASGMRQEMTIAINTQSLPSTDDRTIETGWAKFKMFEYISRAFREGLTPAVDRDMQDLKAKYGVTVPKELEKYLR